MITTVEPVPLPVSRLAVIGVGLIGGSIAHRASLEGWEVTVVDPDLDLVHGSSLWRVERTAAMAVRHADVVVIATPVDAVDVIAEEIAAHVPAGALVTDVASVKQGPVERAARILSEAGVVYVSGHPMAGRAHSGLAHADYRLFETATWLVTGDPAASPVRRLCAFARSLGATRVLAMDVAAHDALVALISHVPQLVVDALAAGVGESASFESAVELAGTGWRDTTRIASSPWETWEPIVRLNRAAIIQPLQRVHEELGRLLYALHTDDTEALAPVFERAIRAREYYEAVRTAPIARQVALARSENVWWDRSLGYRTLRTSAPTAPAHARLALAFLAAQTGHPVEGEMDPDVPYAAEIARVLALPYAETYTADGLLVRGVIIDQELVVLP